MEYRKEKKQEKNKVLHDIYHLNVGDAQAIGQSPITFLRQTMALVTYPELMEENTFPEDVKNRAKHILDNSAGRSIGSYSAIGGMGIVRRQIANFIENEDNVGCDWQNYYIGQGAGDMAKCFLSLITMNENGIKVGVLNPVPSCPTYPFRITHLGLQKIDYYLDEKHQWSINIQELQRTIDEARKSCIPRAMIVINPGNPTGHILTRSNMEDIVRFAFREKLIIIADETYRTNILKEDCLFIPFRKVLQEMEKPYSEMELVTLMSMSDGVYAENGFRCGFSEMKNFSEKIPPMVLRLLSVSPPACNSAQAALYCILNPPKREERSWKKFKSETDAIVKNLQMSASIVEKTMNEMDGLSSNPIQGGMFSFPLITFPDKFIVEAEEIGISPDELYAMKLEEETGIIVLPGHKLGQIPGTYHIRMTLVSDPKKEVDIMEKFDRFHSTLMKNFF